MRIKWDKSHMLIWLTGSALVVSLLMFAGLMLMIVAQGVRYFSPREAVVIEEIRGGEVSGFLIAMQDGEETIAEGHESVWSIYQQQIISSERAERFNRLALVLATLDGQIHVIPVSYVQRIYTPENQGTWTEIGHYASSFWMFLWTDLQDEQGTGGVFPAILGTVVMVFVMSIIVMPFGVLAACYLREYGSYNPLRRIVRIAVKGLAGVPSIVFGVFGLGFFVLFLGGTIDNLFYADASAEPTFARGGILWCALTLALLTAPIVIVTVEEGLAMVPGELREASHALGATRFETLWRVTLPAIMPSILTGLILVVARSAGTVAPLMIIGVVGFTPDMPVDGMWPFLHLEREFMHLAHLIFDSGFKPPGQQDSLLLAGASALLLMVTVIGLNAAAIGLRSRLRRRYSLNSP